MSHEPTAAVLIGLLFPKSTFLTDPLVYPPLGLWYLAAQLEAQGHRTEFRDMSVDMLPADGEFDQLWISATSPQMHEARRLAAETRHWEKTVTVFGGSAPWARPDECAQLGFDLVVAGEADHPATVAHIVDQAERVRWHGPGGVLRPAITPGPLTWALPPVRRWDGQYHAWLEDRAGVRHRTTTMFGSRGCPMACAFCESGRNGVIWDRAVRYEPLALIEAQLREIRDRGHTGVMFYDDILPLAKRRTLGVMAQLKQYSLIWRCFLRTDVIIQQGGYEYLAAMAEAGLVEVLAGVESADNRIKANIHKGTTIEQDTQVLRWCQQLGIKFKASLILGLPGEDRESLERTREWILRERPDRVDVNALIPFPGTPIADRKTDYNGVEFDVRWETELPETFWYKGQRDACNSIVSTSSLTAAEIGAFHDALVKEIIEANIPY